MALYLKMKLIHSIPPTITYECNDYATPSVNIVSYEGVSHLPLSTEQPPLQIQEHPAQESSTLQAQQTTAILPICGMLDAILTDTTGWPQRISCRWSCALRPELCRESCRVPNYKAVRNGFGFFPFMPFTIPSLNYIYIVLTCIYWTGITCPSNENAWTCVPMSPPTKKVTWCWKVHLVYGNLASCHAEKHVASTPASLVEERCPLLIFILLWHYGTNFSTLVLGG